MATTPVRRCAARALVRGSGGYAPGRPLLPPAAREAGGSKGAQPPLASPSVYRLGMLAPVPKHVSQPPGIPQMGTEVVSSARHPEDPLLHGLKEGGVVARLGVLLVPESRPGD